MAKRKCNDSYLDYRFTFVERRDEQLLQCVVCHKTLTNVSMKAHQLKQHFFNPPSIGKKMCILYQWGQIDPSHDSSFEVVFAVFF